MTLPRTSFRDFLAVPPICLLVLCFASVRAAGAGGSTTGRTAGRLGADLHQHGGDRVSPSRALPEPQSVWAGTSGSRIWMCHRSGRPTAGPWCSFTVGATTAGIGKNRIEALRNEGFRVIVKDRLGWGKSSKPILPYSISLHASNTARVLEHLGISEAAVVGHSIGGQMATRFAFLYPGMTTHLVLVNAVGLTDKPSGPWLPPDERGDRGGCGSSGGLRIRRANRSAPLCELETAVHGTPPHSLWTGLEWRVATAPVRSLSGRQPPLDRPAW